MEDGRCRRCCRGEMREAGFVLHCVENLVRNALFGESVVAHAIMGASPAMYLPQYFKKLLYGVAPAIMGRYRLPHTVLDETNSPVEFHSK